MMTILHIAAWTPLALALVATAAGVGATIAHLTNPRRHRVANEGWADKLHTLNEASERDLRACRVCEHPHCPGCQAPAQITATSATHPPHYLPTHDLDQLPATLRTWAALFGVELRARILARAAVA